MEEILKTTLEKLKSEERSFIESIDPHFKELYADIYDCSSKCYLLPTSLSTSKICANNCMGKGNRVKQQIHSQLGKCQQGLQECVRSCMERNQQNQEEGKSCISECSEISIQAIQSLASKAPKMFNNRN